MCKDYSFFVGTLVFVLLGVGCQPSDSRMGIVTDLYEGRESSNPNGMYIFEDELYMQMRGADLGSEVFKYDGVDIIAVTDIAPRTGHSVPALFVAYNGKLYFSAMKDEYGRELWVIDGNRTRIIRDLNGDPASSHPSGMIVF